MKVNRAISIICAALLLGGLTVCTAGCNPDGEDGEETDVTSYTFTWDKYEGASGYSIEKASSRHGNYDYVDYVNANSACEYVADDLNAYYKVTAFTSTGDMVEIGKYSYENEIFGKNTYIYSPDDDVAEIQKELDVFYQQVDGTKEGAQNRARGEFSEERLAVFFKPGEYDVDINIGYYTSLSGLGVSPDDVTVKKISTDAPISLCNFWRTAENLAVDGDMLWSVSQATSLRRVHVKGNLSLSGSGSTSGGFLADTKVDGKVSSGSQQQWFSRNSSFGGWSGCVWNSTFVGVEGENLPENSWLGTANNYTNVENSGKMREKPYLTYDKTYGYRVFVPNVTDGASGISRNDENAGKYLNLDDFYVARSDKDTAATINAALKKGKNLILTAGIYELEAPINIENAGTVVLGLGLATLRPNMDNSDTLMYISDTDNVCIGGILFDAGAHSETLLTVGTADGNSSAPVTLSDLFFRVGGAKEESTSVGTCVVINADNAIGDNFWIWRADHWDGVGWDKNVCDTGIIINGDNATFYGLFVEHFQKFQTVWNGNGGTTYFYQSELPYDVPDAASWSPDGTVNGYASYYVSDSVTTHTAYSIGVYSYLRDAAVTLDNAIVCPETAGMNFSHLVTVWLNGKTGTEISHIINGEGEAAKSGQTVSVFESYKPEN